MEQEKRSNSLLPSASQSSRSKSLIDYLERREEDNSFVTNSMESCKDGSDKNNYKSQNAEPEEVFSTEKDKRPHNNNQGESRKRKQADDESEAPDDGWDEMFERLVAYRAKNGNCLVPPFYSKDIELARWVQEQRKVHKNYRPDLNRKRARKLYLTKRALKLQQLGFQWRDVCPRIITWERRFKELLAFVAKHGHSQIPVKWEQNAALANWINVQRQEYKNFLRGNNHDSKMTKGRIILLNYIGFIWENQAKKGNLYAPSDECMDFEDKTPSSVTATPESIRHYKIVASCFLHILGPYNQGKTAEEMIAALQDAKVGDKVSKEGTTLPDPEMMLPALDGNHVDPQEFHNSASESDHGQFDDPQSEEESLGEGSSARAERMRVRKTFPSGHDHDAASLNNLHDVPLKHRAKKQRQATYQDRLVANIMGVKARQHASKTKTPSMEEQLETVAGKNNEKDLRGDKQKGHSTYQERLALARAIASKTNNDPPFVDRAVTAGMSVMERDDARDTLLHQMFKEGDDREIQLSYTDRAKSNIARGKARGMDLATVDSPTIQAEILARLGKNSDSTSGMQAEILARLGKSRGDDDGAAGIQAEILARLGKKRGDDDGGGIHAEILARLGKSDGDDGGSIQAEILARLGKNSVDDDGASSNLLHEMLQQRQQIRDQEELASNILRARARGMGLTEEDSLSAIHGAGKKDDDAGGLSSSALEMLLNKSNGGNRQHREPTEQEILVSNILKAKESQESDAYQKLLASQILRAKARNIASTIGESPASILAEAGIGKNNDDSDSRSELLQRLEEEVKRHQMLNQEVNRQRDFAYQEMLASNTLKARAQIGSTTDNSALQELIAANIMKVKGQSGEESASNILAKARAIVGEGEDNDQSGFSDNPFQLLLNQDANDERRFTYQEMLASNLLTAQAILANKEIAIPGINAPSPKPTDGLNVDSSNDKSSADMLSSVLNQGIADIISDNKAGKRKREE